HKKCKQDDGEYLDGIGLVGHGQIIAIVYEFVLQRFGQRGLTLHGVLQINCTMVVCEWMRYSLAAIGENVFTGLTCLACLIDLPGICIKPVCAV
ncbi:MAG: hypothetical protein CUN55_21300, partial [Phototrophicales bacterium]